MKNLLNKMNILKKERYITIGYLPKIEYFDRPLYFYENAFALMILHKYVGCFVENHYLSLSFIDNKSEYDINDNGYFFVFTELKALKTALMKYQKSGSKIAIVIPASDENYAGGNYASHLSTLGWFQTKIPHFYIYTSKAIDCWSDFSKNGIIDVTNPPLSVSIMGLAQSEIWGRWSDGKQVLMTFELPKHLRGRKLTLKIPLIHVINGKQRILPILNGEALSEINVSEPRTIDINIGAKFSSSGKISLTLNLPDAVASKDISNNPDTRILGIGFKEIMIAESNPDDI
ncbi:MAG: hypothetical protein LBC04_01900 [Holosporaceae bacterium]|nr:hypothetical protein [Holosporaceae bacterium]